MHTADIQRLTAFDLEHLPTVTLRATGDKLPLLDINAAEFTVTVLCFREALVLPFSDFDGGEDADRK